MDLYCLLYISYYALLWMVYNINCIPFVFGKKLLYNMNYTPLYLPIVVEYMVEYIFIIDSITLHYKRY